MRNRRVVLVQRPEGAVTPACFALRDEAVPEVREGDVFIRNIYLSCDPYMRGRMPASAAQPFALDAVIPARVVGQVEQSRNRDFAQGDFVWGFLGWELFSLAPGGAGLRLIDPALGPLSNTISVRGMPGLTAHVGIVDIGQPKQGETAFISAASGAVGSVAGQLARLKGCRVLGSAGSAAKIAHITGKLGFDAAFDYKNVASIGAALDQHCPDGIDIYFDNVGGETLHAVLERINSGARIAVCGQISHYDSEVEWGAPPDAQALKRLGATMKRFSVRDNMDQFDDFLARMSAWLAAGDIVYFEDIWDGIDATPAAFIDMMKGGNLGKRLVRVGDDPTL